MPKVSVHVVTMNNARFLPCVIRPLAAEPCKDFETQIFEGPSQDGSAEVIEREFAKYPHLKYKMTKSAEASGQPAARQYLLEHCDSDYYLVLDGDDAIVPGHMEDRMAMLDAHSELAGIYGTLALIDENGKALMQTIGAPFSRFLLSKYNGVLHPLHLIRRADALEAGGYLPVKYNMCEDLFLWQRMAVRKSFLYQEDIVGLYRRHSRQMTGDDPASIAKDKEAKQLIAKMMLALRPELSMRLSGGDCELKPEEVNLALILLGTMTSCMPQGSEALPKLLELAMKSAPDDYGAQFGWTAHLMQSGDFEEALSFADKMERRFSASRKIKASVAKLKLQILGGLSNKAMALPAETLGLGVP